jgi:hypothetical protein
VSYAGLLPLDISCSVIFETLVLLFSFGNRPFIRLFHGIYEIKNTCGASICCRGPGRAWELGAGWARWHLLNFCIFAEK